MVPNLAKW